MATMFKTLVANLVRTPLSRSLFFKNGLLTNNQSKSIANNQQIMNLLPVYNICYFRGISKINKPQLQAGSTLGDVWAQPCSIQQQSTRHFHAKGSKVHYMDFRYRLPTCRIRSHLLIVRRQKMKKHRRQKRMKKFKCLLAKNRLKREIAKEKAFRVELLTIIKRAEQFDPRVYALNKIAEINNKPKELSREERLEELKELIRKHRYQVDYVKPKHKRLETLGVSLPV